MKSRQRGQAMVEYFIVAFFIVVVGLLLGDPDRIDEIITAIKNFFRAFSYAISIPSQDRF